jgi:hypothetical protein
MVKSGMVCLCFVCLVLYPPSGELASGNNSLVEAMVLTLRSFLSAMLALYE